MDVLTQYKATEFIHLLSYEEVALNLTNWSFKFQRSTSAKETASKLQRSLTSLSPAGDCVDETQIKALKRDTLHFIVSEQLCRLSCCPTA